MAENLKDLVEKLKLRQKENSQNSEEEQEKPKKIEEKDDPEDKDELDELDDEDDLDEEKPVEKPKTDEKVDLIQMQIEMLQNNGRFRVEMLHQMQELNKALVIIAGVLVDLSGNGKG